MEAKALTDRQREVFEFIKGHVVSHGYPPTIREICGQFGFSSPLSAQQHVDALVKKGYVRKAAAKQRALELVTPTTSGIFPVVGRIRAGNPALATEDIEDYIAVDKAIFRADRGFALKVVGNSMIEAGILEGDIVFVDPERSVEEGGIAIAIIGEEATVKRFFRDGDKVRLVPENKDMQPIIVDASEVRIVGRVMGMMRRL
ncbi:MAG: repressor LexA [Nitrospirae bacterium]|nr:repressor LexA [Nitrospirota bacterium]